jgi:hypothetical protein
LEDHRLFWLLLQKEAQQLRVCEQGEVPQHTRCLQTALPVGKAKPSSSCEMQSHKQPTLHCTLAAAVALGSPHLSISPNEAYAALCALCGDDEPCIGQPTGHLYQCIANGGLPSPFLQGGVEPRTGNRGLVQHADSATKRGLSQPKTNCYNRHKTSMLVYTHPHASVTHHNGHLQCFTCGKCAEVTT